MNANLDPVLGSWYRHLDKGYEFQVVAYDETDGVVEIQYLNGDVEALEIDLWYEMELEQTEPPEDWAGAGIDFDSEDIGISDEDWNEGLGEWHEERP